MTRENADLTTEAGVRTYLAETPYASTDIVPLSGGTANYVFRLTLVEPHEGRETVVFKHAKPYVKDYHALAFELERQIYEVEALRRVRAWLPAAGSIVTVPKVHLFDAAANVIIMDDAGADSISLKELMKSGKVSLGLAKDMGAAIGVFLGGMHKWGKGNEELCASVKGNKQAKVMSSWAFYGRLKDTLTGAKKDVPKLLDPPLQVDEEDLKDIEAIAKETTEKILAEEHSFVMGDFWPGNLMVNLDDKGELRNIHVLDWELTKAGLPGIDVGQFSAEIHLLRRFHPEICGETATVLLERFLGEYRRAGDPSAEDMRRAGVHLGTHLVVLAGRVEWGEKEVTRAVVLEGVQVVVGRVQIW